MGIRPTNDVLQSKREYAFTLFREDLNRTGEQVNSMIYKRFKSRLNRGYLYQEKQRAATPSPVPPPAPGGLPDEIAKAANDLLLLIERYPAIQDVVLKPGEAVQVHVVTPQAVTVPRPAPEPAAAAMH